MPHPVAGSPLEVKDRDASPTSTTLYLEPLEWTMSTVISDEFTDCGRLLMASLRRHRRSRVVVRGRGEAETDSERKVRLPKAQPK